MAAQVVLLSCVGVAAFLRFYGLDHLPGINGDEAYLGAKSWMSLHGVSIPLRTNSGLLPDPISLTLSWLVHLVGEPSPWTLRLPVALSGVATIAAAFLIARRRWGWEAAIVAGALTACLPPHIVYSRFFWEPSQSPLVCAVWLSAAYSGRVVLFVLAGALASLVHPTNVFLAPMAGLVLVARLGPWRERTAAWRARPWRTAAAAVLMLATLWLTGAYVFSQSGNPIAAMNRLGRVDEWVRFAVSYPNLITGSASYEYIVGPVSRGTLAGHRLVYLALFLVPVAISLIRDHRRLAVDVIGLVASLAVFYVMAGPHAVLPARERYGLWMTMPHVFLAARAWSHVWRNWRIVTAVVCLAALIDVHARYFAPLTAANSITENAFKTAAVEPKLQAVRIIEAQIDPSRRTRVYTDGWWTYWAVRYLSAHKSPAWEVTLLDGRPGGPFPADFQLEDAAPGTRQVFYVGYTGWRFTGAVLRRAPGAVEQVVGGYGNVPILSVFAAR